MHSKVERHCLRVQKISLVREEQPVVQVQKNKLDQNEQSHVTGQGTEMLSEGWGGP